MNTTANTDTNAKYQMQIQPGIVDTSSFWKNEDWQSLRILNMLSQPDLKKNTLSKEKENYKCEKNISFSPSGHSCPVFHL